MITPDLISIIKPRQSGASFYNFASWREVSTLHQPHLIMPFRYFNICKTLFNEALLKSQLHIIFAMHDKYFFHQLGILAGQELRQVFIIAVGTHTSYWSYFSMHFVRHSKYAHLFRSRSQASTQRYGSQYPVKRMLLRLFSWYCWCGVWCARPLPCRLLNNNTGLILVIEHLDSLNFW